MQNLPIQDLTVWIDPLDGYNYPNIIILFRTLEYIKNDLEAVTTLIGVSYNKRPIIGVIGHPSS